MNAYDVTVHALKKKNVVNANLKTHRGSKHSYNIFLIWKISLYVMFYTLRFSYYLLKESLKKKKKKNFLLINSNLKAMYRTFHINVKKQVIINYSNLDLISKYELLIARVTL